MTHEYYLHLYATQQPDLNWENPAVRAAAYDVMRFWVERGCDGFRVSLLRTTFTVIISVQKIDSGPRWT